MEELRQQLGEAVPNAARLMARSLSMTYADFVEQVSLGKVSAAPAIKAMGEEMLFEAEGASARLMDSYEGLRSQIRTQFTLLAKEVGDVGYFDGIKDQMAGLLAYLESDEVAQMAQSLGYLLNSVAEKFVKIVQLMYEWRQELKLLLVGYAAYRTIPAIFAAIRTAKLATAASTGGLALAFSRATTSLDRLRTVEARYGTANVFEQQVRRNLTLVKQASIELGTRKNMITAVTGAERMMAEQMARTNIEMQKAVARKRALNGLMVAGRTAMMAVGGVLGGVLIGALTAYIFKVLEARKETDNLFKTLANDDAMVTFSHIEKAEEHVESLREKLKGLNQELDNALVERPQIYNHAPMFADAGSTLAFIPEEVDQEAIKKSIEDVNEEIAKTLTRISLRRGEALENSVNTMMNAVERTFNARVADFRENQRTAMTALEEEYESSGKMTRQEYWEGQNQIRIALAEKEIEEYRLLLSQRRDMIEDANEADKRLFESMEEDIKKKEKDLADMRARTGPVDTTLNGTSEYLTQLDRELNRTIKKVQDIKYELDFEDQFENLVNSLPEALRENSDFITRLEQIQQAYADLNEQEQLLRQHRGLVAIGNQVQSLGLKYERMGMRAADSMSNLNNEFISNRNLVGYAVDVERINNELYNMGFNARVSADDVTAGVDAIRREAEDLNLVLPETVNQLFRMRDAAINADMASTAESVVGRIRQVQGQISRLNKDVETSYADQRAAIDQAIAAIQQEETATNELSDQQKQVIEDLKVLRGLYGELEAAQNVQKTQLDKMRDAWKDHGKMFEDVAIRGMESFADSMANVLVGSSGNWKQWSKDMLKHITTVITKLMLMKTIIDPMMNYLGLGTADAKAPEAVPHAKGGVMSSAGSMPLMKYAKGGVTGFPQRAYFGEGTTPEAYVPLPDGRTIPVTIANADAIGPRGNSGGSVPVQVNLFNQGGDEQEAESTSRFDGEKMIVDVVLKNLSRPTPMRDAVKGLR